MRSETEVCAAEKQLDTSGRSEITFCLDLRGARAIGDPGTKEGDMMERTSLRLVLIYAAVVLAIAGMALKIQPAVVGSIIFGFAAGLRLLQAKK